jgi:hypothetical protein
MQMVLRTEGSLRTTPVTDWEFLLQNQESDTWATGATEIDMDSGFSL